MAHLVVVDGLGLGLVVAVVAHWLVVVHWLWLGLCFWLGLGLMVVADWLGLGGGGRLGLIVGHWLGLGCLVLVHLLVMLGLGVRHGVCVMNVGLRPLIRLRISSNDAASYQICVHIGKLSANSDCIHSDRSANDRVFSRKILIKMVLVLFASSRLGCALINSASPRVLMGEPIAVLVDSVHGVELFISLSRVAISTNKASLIYSEPVIHLITNTTNINSNLNWVAFNLSKLDVSCNSRFICFTYGFTNSEDGLVDGSWLVGDDSRAVLLVWTPPARSVLCRESLLTPSICIRVLV